MGDKPITSSETAAGIAGTAANTTVVLRVDNNCNIHVTPAPTSAIGTVNYYYDAINANNNPTAPWLSRHFDFLNRHKDCSHTVPDYYLDYGDKYIRRFTDALYPKLSKDGKKWLLEARRLLQRYMENGFKQNMDSLEVETIAETDFSIFASVKTAKLESLELDNAIFRSFAYGTHPAAYIDAGLKELYIPDLWQIVRTPDWADMKTRDGLGQIFDIALYLFKQWGANIGHNMIDFQMQ